MTLTEDINTIDAEVCEIAGETAESKDHGEICREDKDRKKTTSQKTHSCPYEGCTANFSKKNRLETHIRVNHTSYVSLTISKFIIESKLAKVKTQNIVTISMPSRRMYQRFCLPDISQQTLGSSRSTEMCPQAASC